MKRIAATATAGLLTASVLAFPVFAQVDVGVSGDASGGIGVGADVSGAGVGVGLSGGASGGASTDTQTGAGAGGAGAGAATELDAAATATSDAQANLGQVVSSIRSSQTTAADLAAVTDVSAVNVVSIDALAKGESGVAVENAVKENADAVAALQNSIGSNAALSSALETQGVDLATVVAAAVDADGSVTVYTR